MSRIPGNMQYDTSKYPYLHDEESLKALDIRDVMIRAGYENDGSKVYCTNHKKGKVKYYISDGNRCTCYDCHQLESASPIYVVMQKKNMNKHEACEWLEQEFRVDKIPNPDYDGERQAHSRRTAPARRAAPAAAPKPQEITYEQFDPSKACTHIDTEQYRSSYPKMKAEQRLKMAMTDYYRFALGTNQKAKYGYYADRGIKPNRKMEAIAYLSAKSFAHAVQFLKERYPLRDLVEFGLIHGDDSKTPGEFKLNYVKRGGLLLVPSFDLYTDMVTGFMARPTHPPKWMKERKMKEIQMSKTDIVKPLPFGLTHEMLLSKTPFVFTTEGHPDGLALPDEIEVGGNTHPTFAISTPGVNGYSEEMLGLLRGKTVILAYDQDDAGRIGASGYVEIQSQDGTFKYPNDDRARAAIELKERQLQLKNAKFMRHEHVGLVQRLANAGVSALVLEWNPRLGGDINDVLINGNIDEVVEQTIKPLIAAIPSTSAGD
ncbi:toprim domain-containing protein [Thiomicrolovo sp. ZZH C-3]